MNQEQAWTEFAIRVRPEAVESVSTLLTDLSGTGVSIEPAVQALGPDEGYVLDETAPQRLVAYFEGEISQSGRAAMRRMLQDRGLLEAVEGRFSWRRIKQEDWAESWKAYYDVEHVGRLVIQPSWREYGPKPNEKVIKLDPGMAFGTGQHPTTRMCLEGLQRLLDGPLPPRDTLALDLGCGSGILAIAAVALGAPKVLAVDTEELAVTAARANVRLNGMEKRIEVRPGSIESIAGDGPFNLILANINAATIESLACDLAGKLAGNGRLLAAGVVREREREVSEALTGARLRIDGVYHEGEWRTFEASHA